METDLNSFICYVDDLIAGMILLMNSDQTGPINIGNPNEFTIKQLAELVIKKIDPSLELLYKPLPSDDPLQRKPLIKLAKSKLNWEPKIEINEGLDKTINYFNNILN